VVRFFSQKLEALAEAQAKAMQASSVVAVSFRLLNRQLLKPGKRFGQV